MKSEVKKKRSWALHSVLLSMGVTPGGISMISKLDVFSFPFLHFSLKLFESLYTPLITFDLLA